MAEPFLCPGGILRPASPPREDYEVVESRDLYATLAKAQRRASEKCGGRVTERVGPHGWNQALLELIPERPFHRSLRGHSSMSKVGPRCLPPSQPQGEAC